MITVFTALAMQAAVQPPQPEWVAFFKIHAKRLNKGEVVVANRYASCISHPYFPMPDQFAAKREGCRASSGLEKSSAKLGAILNSLDSIVRNHPGSEASLTVVKD
jgi:hypothetical protein